MKKTSFVLVMVIGVFVLLTVSVNVVLASDREQAYGVSGDKNKIIGNQNPLAEGIVIAQADSCTNWMQQPNNCTGRTCVDSNGKQYCEQCCAVVTSTGTYTNSCSRVKCQLKKGVRK